jgi:hypothetical protein
MTSLSDLKKAVRDGNTELVRELAEELVNDDVYIGEALELAKNINRAKRTRGMWDDIVSILQGYFE